MVGQAPCLSHFPLDPQLQYRAWPILNIQSQTCIITASLIDGKGPDAYVKVFTPRRWLLVSHLNLSSYVDHVELSWTISVDPLSHL